MSVVNQPSMAHIDFSTGVIPEAAEITERHLSDLSGAFQDQPAVHELLQYNPLIYRVFLTQPEGDPHRLYTGSTVLEPGQIGREYFMTKGHFHLASQAPEVYLTLSGHGRLMMQTRSGETAVQSMEPGLLNYIPGEWAHRTINTGHERLVFFAVWPGDAGHDYESIAQNGFAQLVLAGADGPEVVANPSFRLGPSRLSVSEGEKH